MQSGIDPPGRHTFVVKVTIGGAGQLTGLIRNVRTGEKRRVGAIADLGRVIEGMIQDNDPGDAETR